MCAEPDELALPGVHVRFERVGIGGPHAGVQAVAADHEVIVFSDRLDIVELGFEPQVDPKLARPLL